MQSECWVVRKKEIVFGTIRNVDNAKVQRRHVKTVCALHYGMHLSCLVINGMRDVYKFLVLILQLCLYSHMKD